MKTLSISTIFYLLVLGITSQSCKITEARFIVGEEYIDVNGMVLFKFQKIAVSAAHLKNGRECVVEILDESVVWFGGKIYVGLQIIVVRPFEFGWVIQTGWR